MLEFAICLLVVATIGYLSQTTGLCMVRGMKEWMGGKPRFMAAILVSGIFAWVAGMLSGLLGSDPPYQRIAFNSWFAVGGLLFGAGAAFNQGCGVSTLGRLSRGELGMLTTILGWLTGWYLLDRWGPSAQAQFMEPTGMLTFGILAACSLVMVVWLWRGDASRRKLWFAMFGIGLLGGFMFLHERGWTPSGLLHDLSAAARGVEESPWPHPGRYLIILFLLSGMAFVSIRTKSFQLRVPSAKAGFVHLLAGTSMGIGAALARGGNDSQLLLTLPVFSPAGITAVASMLVGLYLGLRIRGPA